jgi:hypothetical protein
MFSTAAPGEKKALLKYNIHFLEYYSIATKGLQEVNGKLCCLREKTASLFLPQPVLNMMS